MGAVAWGYVFFGLTDLLVIFIDPGFYAVFLLETGWGLLFLVLVAVPLIAVVIRPRSPVLLVQVLAVAAGVAVAAVITPAWSQLFPAVGLIATAVLVGLLARQGFTPGRGVGMQSVDPVLVGLVMVAAVPAVRYAGQMMHAARTGVPDDITWGLPHLPMQAAFAFALVLAGLVAAVGEGRKGARRSRRHLVRRRGPRVVRRSLRDLSGAPRQPWVAYGCGVDRLGLGVRDRCGGTPRGAQPLGAVPPGPRLDRRLHQIAAARASLNATGTSGRRRR